MLDPKMRSNSLQMFDGRFVGADARRREGEGDRQVRLRRADRGPAGARPLHAAAQAQLRRRTTCCPTSRRTAMAAVAREVIEAYGDAQRLGDGQSGRHRTVPAEGMAARPADRARGESRLSRRALSRQRPTPPTRRSWQGSRGKQAAADRRVEISIIEEANPRLLAFEQRRARLHRGAGRPRRQRARRRQHAEAALRQGAASRSQRGVQPAITYTYFNMEDPVVGGYTPEKIALRRAIGMAYNVDEEIRVMRQGQGMPATQLVPPGVTRLRPDARRRRASTTRARRQGAARQVRLRRPRRRRLARSARRQAARAAAWARSPAAQRARSTTSCGSAASTAIGIKIEFVKQKWPDLLKMARARAAADVAARQHQHDAPTATGSSACCTAATPASRTSRASSCPSSTGSTSRRERCRTAPSARSSCARCRSSSTAYAPWMLNAYRYRERARVSMGDRLQVQRVQPASVAVPRHRHAARGAAVAANERPASRRASSSRSLSRWRCRCAGSRRADPAKVAARRVPDRRDGLRPAGVAATSTPTHVHRAIFEPPYDTTTSRGRTRSCRARRSRCPRSPPTARTWTIRVKPGIYFADDPAFKGKKRELTADDFVYAWKRLVDPKMRSPFACTSTASWSAPTRSLDAGESAASSITTRRSRAARASTATRCGSSSTSPTTSCSATCARARWPRSRAKSSRRTATRAAGRWPIRSAPVRIRLKEWRRGAEDRARGEPELSRRVLSRAGDAATIARSRRRCRASACRRSAASRSRSSRNRIRGCSRSTAASSTTSTVPADLVPNVLDAANQLQPAYASAGRALERGVQPSLALHLLQHGRSGRRRLHEGQDRAAPRDHHGATTRPS